MSQIFPLPDVGEGLTEAEILSWKVAVGTEVAINDVLVEIETAKSVVELPSPFAGAAGDADDRGAHLNGFAFGNEQRLSPAPRWSVPAPRRML